ncbi:hypothetical protein AUC69_09415 [Methyloceanibacter superfactus]|uniref:DUF2177 domain-containing protein n=1 Tax=Methyloceanibacter superfactus TaxID=1774969 RepID=A0A1E3W011_9HYPH|nr:DUF2177 family protein [Methyloceanibacter superfactus]ODR99138.1 hypothetical protein AUC69_09415 [Methyloceanibacter superfactus]
MTYFVAYIAAAAGFLLLDFLWLGFVAKGFYRQEIGALLLDQFNMVAAIGFYLVFVVGIVIFAVLPALQTGSWKTALLYGALFGFFTYATYDMTNLATLKGWSLSVTFVDIAWGTLLTGTASLLGYAAARAVSG